MNWKLLELLHLCPQRSKFYITIDGENAGERFYDQVRQTESFSATVPSDIFGGVSEAFKFKNTVNCVVNWQVVVASCQWYWYITQKV